MSLLEITAEGLRAQDINAILSEAEVIIQNANQNRLKLYIKILEVEEVK